jgi:hypothetical protein
VAFQDLAPVGGTGEVFQDLAPGSAQLLVSFLCQLPCRVPSLSGCVTLFSLAVSTVMLIVFNSIAADLFCDLRYSLRSNN